MTPRNSPRTTLVRRMRNLAVLEPVNIVIFGLVAFVVLPAPLNTVNVTGFVLVAVHLLIGGAYWAIKVRQLRARLPVPPMIAAFWWLRRLCETALVAGFVVLAVFAARGEVGLESVPGVLFYLMAVAEYVNYFHWQLSHQTSADLARLLRTRRVHRSHLYLDMRAHRS
ncbi:hypothetical protein [Nonomuraea longispora]|uniref:hypothetical protein n=1 Tax=Nonomuraea longispora TaxID=1848320 RepID=UPI001C702012|nr:hypothetical protein [Nonomuraea longispora]